MKIKPQNWYRIIQTQGTQYYCNAAIKKKCMKFLTQILHEKELCFHLLTYMNSEVLKENP